MFPVEFTNALCESLGESRAERVLSALSAQPEVSVRVNPFKLTLGNLRSHFGEISGEPVPWASDEGFYLRSRPSFTQDPLFHAGAYYVQEASSMYVAVLLEQAMALLGRRVGLHVLDLCAAPGGKTTQILSRLDDSSLLLANEVVSARATTLALNVARWGCCNVAVANSDPSAFAGLPGFFDLAVVDAPCSGEGMFRKDERAVAEWSPETVRLCAARQRRILADMWPSLAPGGFMIYSTCTFNRHEDEDNVAWICSELGAGLVGMRHFYPGEDRGEGFFAALLRKTGAYLAGNAATPSLPSGLACVERGKLVKVFPAALARDFARLEKALRIIASGTAVATRKGRDLVPEAALALAADKVRSALGGMLPELVFEAVEISREEALRFLSKEPLSFPGSPRGYLLLSCQGLGLGFVKNLGSRTNSLLPNAWRIRNTHGR